MFIFTARVHKKRLAAGAVALVLLCGGALALSSRSVPAAADAAVTVEAPSKLKSNEDKIAYLESLGWQVAPEPIAVEELLIPEEFDESYQNYLALQQEQGFDLSQYQGKRVKRYSYEILNYSTGEGGVQVSLLIYKHKVIGGEVLSPKLDGFVHGLKL